MNTFRKGGLFTDMKMNTTAKIKAIPRVRKNVLKLRSEV